MKVSLNWLKKYINLEGIELEKITSSLTISGLEIEGIEEQAKKYENIVIAKVVKKEKHPSADKLSVCVVNTGTEETQVVCGAPNVEAGQTVVFAKIGAVIPAGNFQIGEVKLRGVQSNGMICSKKELEIGEDHSGIWVLQDGIKPGTALSEYLDLTDTILEVGITPNRPDALSHIGIARDLAAIFNLELKLPAITRMYEVSSEHEEANVEIIDETNCPRYSAAIIKNCTVKESPEFLRQRLEAAGMRSINNIVDITNFVLLELGQPLHAFDLDKLHNSSIIVKSGFKEEEFITLDSQNRKLTPETLMICDGEKPVAIGGVMGGENSEVTSETKNILLESAYFNPVNIRKTAKHFGISSEASYRFERGTNIENTVFSAIRAAEMICELAGGEIVGPVIDVYPVKYDRRIINLRFNRISYILGYEIPLKQCVTILRNLGFGVNLPGNFKGDDNNAELEIDVPLFRPDVEREIDLIEELARIYGYDKIPEIYNVQVSLDKKIDTEKTEVFFRNSLKGLGLNEIMTNSLTSNEVASLVRVPVTLMNAQGPEMSALRTSLIPGALSTALINFNVKEKDLSLFEIGKIFSKKDSTSNITFDTLIEETAVSIMLTGNRNNKTWYSDEVKHDIFDIKGFINELLKNYYFVGVLQNIYFYEDYGVFDSGFHILNSDKEIVGTVGKINNKIALQFGIKQEIYAAEIVIEKLPDIKSSKKKYVEPPAYPKIIRDMALVLDENISYYEVEDFISNQSFNLLKSIELFDIFRNDAVLGTGKKSLAFSLEYFDLSRTLKDDEVEKEFKVLLTKVQKKFNASLRG